MEKKMSVGKGYGELCAAWGLSHDHRCNRPEMKKGLAVGFSHGFRWREEGEEKEGMIVCIGGG